MEFGRFGWVGGVEIALCPECGEPETATFIEAVGQCNSCEEGYNPDDCYHLDESNYPDYSDGPEHYDY